MISNINSTCRCEYGPDVLDMPEIRIMSDLLLMVKNLKSQGTISNFVTKYPIMLQIFSRKH